MSRVKARCCKRCSIGMWNPGRRRHRKDIARERSDGRLLLSVSRVTLLVWWPDLRLDVVEDRTDRGIRWTVSGALTGTMEIWLEPSLDGVVLHYFLHAEPTGVAAWQLAKLNLAKMTHRRRVAGKKMAFEVKTTLERSRPVGVSPVV